MEASKTGDCLFSLHLKNCTKATTTLRSPLQKPQLAEVRGGDFLSNFQPHTFEYPKNLVKRTFLSFHTPPLVNRPPPRKQRVQPAKPTWDDQLFLEFIKLPISLFQQIAKSVKMAAQAKHDWADDDDLDELTTADLPPPQKIQNKDGSTTIIEYRYNDQNQKVKTTRRIRYITHREVVNPRVAERKAWAKFGQSAKDGAGPAPDTTSVGENIIFRPSINWKKDAKDESKDPNAQAMKDKLKDKKVKCRICNGEHFTARCPYKDTMAPIGEAAGADVAAGMGDDAGAGGAGPGGAGAPGAGKKGSYVPPALRGAGGAAGAGAGERMGGKYGERDDLATLRVTNVSEMAEENELRDMFERFGRVTRVFLAKDRDTGLAKGFAFISFADRGDAVKACAKMDGFGFRHLILRVEFAKKAA
ncbi:translation initiation factor eIF3 subunit g [Podospora pseudoanserina]|uniref:Eukaryotic translation initiation factor 3 subunit G n=1 Tax=Podospora pseudoanserina TaxID=2609844 RepID=A0ABR0HTM5_9PEZI|nr:translation initiation factor eIF3 subunit g [Podospora pseudoanserina]